ncbi:hypothetical protein [Microcella sp.]|uniref:hypothetical protein n=1 Tax=Microcella sp. TaxID=1913979 RepID=UPI003F6FFD66
MPSSFRQWARLPLRDPLTYGLVAAAILVGAGLVVILTNIPRGLDLTDESWILVLVSQNQLTPGEPWGFQHIAHPLWNLLGESIIGARVGRFLLYQSAVALATWSVTLLGRALGIRLSRTSIAIVFISAQAAALNAWAYWPRAFGYNEFAAFFSTAGVSLVVAVIATQLLNGSLSRRQRLLYGASLGVLAGLLLLTKLTSGVVLALGVIVALAILPRALQLIGTFVLAALATVGGAWLLGYPLGNYVSSAVRMATDAAYAASFARPPGLLQANIRELLATAVDVLPALLLIVALLGAALLGDRLGVPRFARNLTSIGLLGLYATAVSAFDTGENLVEKTGVLGLHIGVFAAGALLAWRWSQHSTSAGNSRRTLLIVVAALAILVTPFISSVGTNNPLILHITYNQTIWGAACGLGIVVLVTAMGTQPVRRAVAAGALVVVALLGMMGVLLDQRSPYRQVAYAEQTEPTRSDNPLLSGLRLPPETVAAFVDLERIGAEFANTPVIAPGSPGSILVFNNVSFASPFTEAFWPGSYGTVAAECQRNGSPDDLVVILPSWVTEDTRDYELLVDALSQGCGIAFPEDFVFVDSTREDVAGIQYPVWSLDDVD